MGFFWTEKIGDIFELSLIDGIPDNTSVTRFSSAGTYYSIVAFDFSDEDTMYVLETQLGDPNITGITGGQLTKVNLIDNTTTIVADGSALEVPSGMLIYNGKLYITNNTYDNVLPCKGEIICAELPTDSAFVLMNAALILFGISPLFLHA